MTFSGFSFDRGLIGKITTRTFGLSDMHATPTIWAHFWRAAYLHLMKKAHPQQQRLPNTRQKRNYNNKNISAF